MNEVKNGAEESGKAWVREVPARIALHYSVFPLARENGKLRLAVPQGISRQVLEELGVVLGFGDGLEFSFLPRPEIQALISKAYGVGAGVIELLAGDEPKEAEDKGLEKIDAPLTDDPTVTKLVNELLRDALKRRASDIHLEPFEETFRIRYRVDGRLIEAGVSEKILTLAKSIASRIKIMAKLDIGEKRLPQDGRIKIRQGREELDLRVSVLPSCHGESIVIRILKPLELLSLQDLGFCEEYLKKIRSQLQKPHGMILMTGPTGSGKTTTLYACLKELNQMERKIITIEDPVEYKLPGIIQMQVHSKIDFSFARALRSMLRHDPDCLMVGEIRDAETAEIAIRSALTGHLVFSTLHTHDAPSAVTRLVEMGIEPYLVASSLEAVIAQRLVRKFCPSCGGRGGPHCKMCEGDGFYGRLAISEIMPVEETLRDLILEKKTGSILRRQAIRNGLRCLLDDGLEKVKRGLTSESEILAKVSGNNLF